MRYKVTIVKSNRKTLSIHIKSSKEIEVRAPKWVSKREIDRVLDEKSLWISEHLEAVKKREVEIANQPRSHDADIHAMERDARKVIVPKVEYYAQILGVDYGRIAIRNQKTRWGSCSSKGNLNFNCNLLNCPEELIDYVVVHELCHRIEMNHSSRFWNLVESIIPDYKERRKRLKTYEIGI